MRPLREVIREEMAETLWVLVLCVLFVLSVVSVAPVHGANHDADARAALALAIASEPSSGCPCGPACPLGGGCGALCPCKGRTPAESTQRRWEIHKLLITRNRQLVGVWIVSRDEPPVIRPDTHLFETRWAAALERNRLNEKEESGSVKASGCPCGPLCPLGGGCGPNCPCPTRKASSTPTRSAPDQSGKWQWEPCESREGGGYWWKWREAPVSVAPVCSPAVCAPVAFSAAPPLSLPAPAFAHAPAPMFHAPAPAPTFGFQGSFSPSFQGGFRGSFGGGFQGACAGGG